MTQLTTPLREWGLVLLLLLATFWYTVVILSIVAAGTDSKHTTALPGGLPTTSRIQTTTHLETLPPLAPMWWDANEGAYMVSLMVGAGMVELVLDTGSSQLGVKGEGVSGEVAHPSVAH